MSAQLHNITKNNNSSQSLLILGAVRYCSQMLKSEGKRKREEKETMPQAPGPRPQAPGPRPNTPVAKLRSPLAVKICQTSL